MNSLTLKNGVSMFVDIKNDALSILAGNRIPRCYRTDVNDAKKILSVIKTILNKTSPTPEIIALSRWAKFSFDDCQNLENEYSEIKSISEAGKQQTYDLTVPQGSSYVVNGIVCHNTTNIPNSTSIDVVKQIYTRGWETGCKGVTIYREGTREGVLQDVNEKKKNQSDGSTAHAPKRPKELECDIHHVSIKGEKYLIFIGLMEGKPYEVFAGLSEQVDIPRKIKKGFIVKNGKNDVGLTAYNLRVNIDENSLTYKDIVNLFDNPLYGAHTRSLSLALRHGVPVNYIVEQLRKDKHSDLFSFSTVIARTLSKNYIPDGTKSTQEKTCPTCTSTNLSYQSGCVTCMNCGWSLCG